MSRNLYLISYDISEPAAQRKILKLIKSYAIGGQKSFYECWMTKQELNAFQSYVFELIDAQTDSVMLFQLDPRLKPQLAGQHTRITFNPFVVI